MESKRNEKVDIIRGLAILMVILGHTITSKFISDYENNYLYKIIFSLQIPLFMIISGYVTIFTKPLNTVKSFGLYVVKRAVSYLLPWFVWTIIIRGFLLDSWTITNIPSKFNYLLWHMDTGYWFLFSLWTICMIWGISSFIANKFAQKDLPNIIITSFIAIVLGLGLLAVGITLGLSFLSIKFTLYYLPFFFIGYLFSKFYPIIEKKKYFILMRNIVIFISLCIYTLLTVYFNVYLAQETLRDIILRMICSVTGCTIFIYIINCVFSDTINGIKKKTAKLLSIAGRQSIGLYLSHYLFLNLIRPIEKITLNSFEGFGVCIVNYFIAIFLTSALIYIISRNNISKFVLFGKK